MIDANILKKIRNGVCAVGYLTVPLDEYVKCYEVPEMFEVIGTGFLVRESTVVTNRHVIDNLERTTREKGIPMTQRFLSFVVPRTEGHPGITVRQIRHAQTLRDGKIDVGFLEFKIVHPAHFQDIEQPSIDTTFRLKVSEQVGAFGYPHGSTLTDQNGKVRWGPLLQQGWVSGMTPYEGASPVDEILLDLRTDEGMSGSPIFRLSDGSIVGILHTGITPKAAGVHFGTTTVFCQPLYREILRQWLVEFDRELDT